MDDPAPPEPVPAEAGVELRYQPGLGRSGVQLQRLVKRLVILPPTGHPERSGAASMFAGVDHAVWHWFLADGRDVQLMLVDRDGRVDVDLDVFRLGGGHGPYEASVLSARGVTVGEFGRVLGQVRMVLADVVVPELRRLVRPHRQKRKMRLRKLRGWR